MNRAHPSVQAVIDRLGAVNKALRSGRIDAHTSMVLKEGYATPYGPGTLAVGRGRAAEPGAETGDDSIIHFTTTVLQEDRDGDVVVPMGADFANFEHNPVWFFGHQEWEIPVGVGEDLQGNLMAWKSQDRIRQGCRFDMDDPDAHFIHGKVKRGILRATSMAFVPLVARRREVEKARTHGDGKGGMPPGWLFERYDVTETSVVGVPSNAGAIRDALDTEKSFISPRCQKALGSYAAQAKGCWNGWCPGPNCRQKYVRHEGDKWVVHAESGKVLGTHDSKEDAEAQLRAVEANKHKALEEGKGRGQTPAPSSVTGYQVGDTVYTRTRLTRLDPSGKTVYCARTGDRLSITGREGPQWQVRCPDGGYAYVGSTEVRRGVPMTATKMSPAGSYDYAVEVRVLTLCRGASRSADELTGALGREFTDQDVLRAAGRLVREGKLASYNSGGDMVYRTKEAPVTTKKSCGCGHCKAGKPCPCKGTRKAATQADVESNNSNVTYTGTPRAKSVEERGGQYWVVFGDGTERGPFASEEEAMTVHRQPDASAKGIRVKAPPMTNRDRDRIRKLQDKLLALPAVQRWENERGGPLFEGGPSVNQLRSMLYPQWEDRLEGILRDFSRKSAKKALSSTSGTAGGYTVPVDQDTVDTDAPGVAYCIHCDGSGNCPRCEGGGEYGGEPCQECGGGGECQACGGQGMVAKSVHKAGGVRVLQTGEMNGVVIYGVVDASGKRLNSMPFKTRQAAADWAQSMGYKLEAKVAAMATKKAARDRSGLNLTPGMRVSGYGKSGTVQSVGEGWVKVKWDDGTVESPRGDALDARTAKGADMATSKNKGRKGAAPARKTTKAPARKKDLPPDEDEERDDDLPIPDGEADLDGEERERVEDKAEGEEGGEEYPEEKDEGEEEPFQPKDSALKGAMAYQHMAALKSWLEKELPTMDHPGMAEGLTKFKDEHLPAAMDHVKGLVEQHHPDHDFDSMVKALESDGAGPADQMGSGEAGMVNNGQQAPNDVEAGYEGDAVPFAGEETPEEELLEEEVTHEGDIDPEDPANDEILERYQTPKGWQTRSLGTVRRTKDGRTFLVRKDAGKATPATYNKNVPHPYVEATKDAAEFLGDVATTPEVPKALQVASKHHHKQLTQVCKAMTQAGKTQRDGGPGSPLTDEGTAGNKGSMKDKGEVEADGRAGTPSGEIVEGSGKLSPQKAAPKLHPALVEEFAKTLTVARTAGIKLNGSN